MTEQVPEFFEAIIRAAKELKTPIQDLSLDQFEMYIDKHDPEYWKPSTLFKPVEILESEWERMKDLAVIIDTASKQIAEQYRFKIDPSPDVEERQEGEHKPLIKVESKKRVIGLSMLTTLLCVFLSAGALHLVSMFNSSISFEMGIIPAIAIPLILGPIISYVLFMQSHLLTQVMNQLEELRKTDPLTKLYNRRFFTELVDMELDVASRYQFTSSLLLIDLDHFKGINDTYGYLAGDEVLCILSEVIKRNVRRTDIIGRFGGDEIMIFLPHTNLEGALVAAERIRKMISESEISFEDERFKMTASIGAASTEFGLGTFEQLLQGSHTAMCTAKRRGRNELEYHQPVSEISEMDAEVIELQSG